MASVENISERRARRQRLPAITTKGQWHSTATKAPTDLYVNSCNRVNGFNDYSDIKRDSDINGYIGTDGLCDSCNGVNGFNDSIDIKGWHLILGNDNGYSTMPSESSTAIMIRGFNEYKTLDGVNG